MYWDCQPVKRPRLTQNQWPGALWPFGIDWTLKNNKFDLTWCTKRNALGGGSMMARGGCSRHHRTLPCGWQPEWRPLPARDLAFSCPPDSFVDWACCYLPRWHCPVPVLWTPFCCIQVWTAWPLAEKNSPDINPIEHLCNRARRLVWENHLTPNRPVGLA